MKEKRQAKFMADSPKKKGSSLWIVVQILALVVVAMGIVLVLQRAQINANSQSAPDDATVYQEPVIKLAAIDTAYGQLQFGEDYMSNIRHEEVVNGDLTMEVFNMICEEGEWLLFSVCFGDTDMGQRIGKIHADGKDIPVSVVVGSYAEENFPDNDAYKMYYVLMDQLDVVLTSIRSGENFVAAGSYVETDTAKQTEQMT